MSKGVCYVYESGRRMLTGQELLTRRLGKTGGASMDGFGKSDCEKLLLWSRLTLFRSAVT